MSLNENEGFMGDADREGHSSSRNSESSSHQGQLRASVSQSRVDVARVISNHVMHQINESRHGHDVSRTDNGVKRIESVRLDVLGGGLDFLSLSYFSLCGEDDFYGTSLIEICLNND